MSNTLVTAWFDIGRVNWNQHSRSAEEYIDRFSNLAKLDTNLIIYTTRNYAGRLEKIRADNGFSNLTKVVIVEFPDPKYADILKAIEETQQHPDFTKHLMADVTGLPQYQYPEYVLVTTLKSSFVADAIERGLVTTEHATWVDFGFMVTPSTELVIPPLYPEHISAFPLEEIADPDAFIYDSIVNAYSTPSTKLFTAPVTMWRSLSDEMLIALELVLENGMVAKDTVLFSICNIKFPHVFESNR
jgi:hypothetical protein